MFVSMQPEEATATVVTMRAPISLTLDLKYMNLTLDLKYMNPIAKVSALFNQVKICLSTTYPLMVECKIGQTGYIRYSVAPKGEIEIEEEEIKKEKERERDRRGRDQRGMAKKKGEQRKRKGAKRSKGAEMTRDQREGGRGIEEEKEGIQKESKDRIG